MTKIRSANHLQDLLDAEFSWRLKEIHDIRSATKATAGATSQRAFIRTVTKIRLLSNNFSVILAA